MTRDDFKQSPEFKTAVKVLYLKCLAVGLLSSVFVGWYFHDILNTFNTPLVQASLGEFMGVSIVVYVAANVMIRWLECGPRK